MNLGLDKRDLCFVIYMFLSNNPSSGDINSSNLLYSLFLQVTRATIKSRMGLKFGRIRPGTYELAALEHLEKSP